MTDSGTNLAKRGSLLPVTLTLALANLTENRLQTHFCCALSSWQARFRSLNYFLHRLPHPRRTNHFWPQNYASVSGYHFRQNFENSAHSLLTSNNCLLLVWAICYYYYYYYWYQCGDLECVLFYQKNCCDRAWTHASFVVSSSVFDHNFKAFRLSFAAL